MGPTQVPNHTPIILVNPTDRELTDVRIESGGFYTDETLGVVHSNARPKELGRIGAYSYVLLEDAADEELGDFVVWWRVSHGLESPRLTLKFGLFKGRGAIGMADVPVLGTAGSLIPRNER